MMNLVFAVCAIGAMTLSASEQVLVEAERFADHGGWVLDQQFMDQMGSSYLLAHGLGVPVEDAVTTAIFPVTGRYRVWVRTKNWVASWGITDAPGRFQVRVDGQTLDTTFGTEGAAWHWQDGGIIEIAEGVTPISLHDLTGFEGRCDAILFSRDLDFVPPNEGETMAQFRRNCLEMPDTPEDVGSFDLVVVGGGVAGTCAALSAARLDSKVALIQDRPVLGGNNSSEVRVWLSGSSNYDPYPRIGDLVWELGTRTSECPDVPKAYRDDRKLQLVRAESNITLFLDYRGNEVVMDGSSTIDAVVAQHIRTGRRIKVRGKLFADCTGDGCIGALAGADNEMTVDGHMGRTNLWRTVDTGKPSPFPACPWAYDLSDKKFPEELERLGKWFWESGFFQDPIVNSEQIRDNNFRAMYGAWDALKNVKKRYPNHRLEWAAYIAGKRESRRLLGDLVLTKRDLVASREYEDGCVPTSWTIDLHLPEQYHRDDFGDNAFLSVADFTKYPRPYWVPYRCLYSRNIDNLFMAGRDISVTHEALGTVRVMVTTGMMGEVVGMAAAVCRGHDVKPRAVYKKYLDELKTHMKNGVGRLPLSNIQPPTWMDKVGENLALEAKVTSSGDTDPDKYPLRNVNDGRAITTTNDGRWLGQAGNPAWLEFAWESPQTIAGARVISGYREGKKLSAPIQDFEFQYDDGETWHTIPGTETSGNITNDWGKQFEPISTKRVRLNVTRVQQNAVRIWEVELYAVDVGE